MSYSIQTNVSALIAQENLRVNNEFQSRTIQRLTSGFRINSSGDDAAGLAVANMYRSDTAELVQGVRNANDGISQLQIIDGGMNNISKMLDRLKTLATQSASKTFTGSRVTLNNEYSQLLLEIDRQASNIGLNSSGRYNSTISVYTGGATNGSAANNAKVTVDLSGAANAVDSKALGISGTNISGAGISLGAATATVTANQVFTFQTIDSGGAQTSVQLTARAAASGGTTSTREEVVAQLNRDVANNSIAASMGLTFALDSSGNLTVGAMKAFSVTSDAGAAGKLLATTVTDKINLAQYNQTYTGGAALSSTSTGTMVLTNSVGETRTISLAAGLTVQQQVDAINEKGKEIGIYALQTSTAGTVAFFGQGSFTTAFTATAGGLGTAGALTAADSSLDPTQGAVTAIAKLGSAVTALGSVQGKIGSGQNKLAYAIQLAQSQISAFSAAESRIRDADVAAEAANLTKAQVLQQASIAAMAQANSAPQAVLSLLRG